LTTALDPFRRDPYISSDSTANKKEKSYYNWNQEEDMKVNPIGDRVLVKLEEVEEKTASGIFIPQTAQEKTQTGTVEAVGDDESITVKAGEKVMYDKYAGTTIKVDGKDMLLVRMSDIMAVIE
jgi:chaperonin GroES